MKTVLVCVIACLGVFGQTKPSKSAGSKPKAKNSQPNTAAALVVPEGATQVEPFTWKYTDATGNKWVYRKTPFGTVRFEDTPPPVNVVDSTNPIRFTEEGENVHFEWTSPFGKQIWTKKKSELTDDEKAMMLREQKKAAAIDNAASVKPGK